jgi:TPR repeat protein
MKVPFCSLTLLLASVAPMRADFAAGKHAYEQGDFATALKELMPSAEHGNPEAQFLLGKMYARGQGLPPNPVLALKWFTAAADQGSADGQLQLGLVYLNGPAGVKDTAQALKWLKLSAGQGNPDAPLFLGLAYRNLPDIRDYVQAYMWLQLAAEHGDPLAPKQRDGLQGMMTREQIAQARALAAAWKPTKPTRVP